MGDRNDRPGIVAPPPLLALISILAGLGAEQLVELPLAGGGSMPRPTLAAGIMILASAVFVAAAFELVRHRTTPNPYRPTTAIVTTGIYRITRNPMYVAFLLIVLAVAIAANTAWLLLALAGFFAALHFGVVKREERYLAAKFGSAYEDYRANVRRWL